MADNALPFGVIFDVDGTLVDTLEPHAQAWAEMFREFGISVAMSDIKGQFGKRNDETIRALCGANVPESTIRAMDARKLELFRVRLNDVRPFPGAKELITQLAATGTHVAVASSADSSDLQHFLEIVGIDSAVADRVSAQDVTRSKPDPQMFRLVIDKWKAHAGDVVIVGDSLYDMQAAATVGSVPIGVLTGGFTEAHLRQSGARQVYKSIHAIQQSFPQSLSFGVLSGH